MRYYFITLVTTACALLLGCEKEMACDLLAEGQEVRLEPAASVQDEGRHTVRDLVLTVLRDNEARTALATSLSGMRDGDSEVLLAEILHPAQTRGVQAERAFRNALREAFVGQSSARTRGEDGGFDAAFAQILANDPLLQLLLVAPDPNTPIAEAMQDPGLRIVSLPANFDDSQDIQLTALGLNGTPTLLSSRIQPDFPVLIVGQNERLTTDDGNHPGATYHVTPSATYYFKHGPSFPGRSEIIIDPPTPSPYIPPVTTFRKDFPMHNEYMLKAKFRDQEALRKYESWTLGRPEVYFIAAHHGEEFCKTTTFSEGWWEGKMRGIDIFITRNIDEQDIPAYGVIWIEEDGGDTEKHSFEIGIFGITVSFTYSTGSMDDRICKRLISNWDPISTNGHEYDLGDFSFWVAVKPIQQ